MKPPSSHPAPRQAKNKAGGQHEKCLGVHQQCDARHQSAEERPGRARPGKRPRCAAAPSADRAPSPSPPRGIPNVRKNPSNSAAARPSRGPHRSRAKRHNIQQQAKTNAAPAHPEDHADARIPQQIDERRQGRLVEPDVAIQRFSVQNLNGRSGGIGFLHPDDSAVAEPRGEQSQEQERQHKSDRGGLRRESPIEYNG